MSTPAFYRNQAQRYREMAALAVGSPEGSHMLRVAVEYETLARELEQREADPKPQRSPGSDGPSP